MWCDWNSMGPFGWIMMVVFWGALFAVVLWITVSTQGRRGGKTDVALEVLERRFAVGDIDLDEFEERRRVLLNRDGSR